MLANPTPTKNYQRKFQTIAFIGAVTGILAGALVKEVLESRIRADQLAVVINASESAEKLLGALRDVETGQRGYVLTGDKEFLQPYWQGRSRVNAALNGLEKVIPKHEFDHIQRATKKKIQIVESAITLFDGGGQQKAKDVIASKAGKRVMDELRELVGAQDMEAQIVKNRLLEQQKKRNADMLMLSGMVGGFTLLLLSAIGIFSKQELKAIQSQAIARVAFYKEALGGFAHDIRNPLTGLFLEVDKLINNSEGKRRVPLTPVQISNSYQSLKRIAKRIELLCESSLTAIEGELIWEIVDAVEVVKELILGYSDRAISLEVIGEARLVKLDKRLLSGIVTNLLSNAIKYSQEEVNVKLCFASDALLIDVSDKGIGVSVADLKQIWEPWQRGENAVSYKGSGYGLWWVYQATTKLGGQVDAKSTLNVGSVFTIRLPYRTN